MKKFKSCCLSCILVAVLITVSVTAYGVELPPPYETEGQAVFSVSNPVTVLTVGDAAYVKTDVSGQPENLYGFELVFSYDENFLTYKSYSLKEKDKVVTAEKVSDGILKIAVSSSDNSNIKSSVLTTLNFVAKKSGNTQVTLLEAVVIDSGMGYTKYNDLNKNVSLSIKAKNSGGGSSGGGGGSGGSITVGGGTNSTTGVSPTMEPSNNIPTVIPEETNKPTDIFNDINDESWSKNAVIELYNLGIVNGYEDGSFKPENSVTRAEFLKFIITALEAGVSENNISLPFSDTYNSEWYAPYVSAALNLKMVNGYDDETFRPDSYISREEAAAIVCRGIDAMGISLDSYRLKITFEDENIISDYAVDYVYRLYSSGVINGDENQCFRPKDDMSRAETAQLIWNLINTLNPVESEEQMKVLGKDKAYPVSENDLDSKQNDSDTVESEPSATPTEVPDLIPTPTSIPTEEPLPSETPGSSFDTDIDYECENLAELYSYNNVYAYLIPDDGSRDAFYDDFTTFQRAGDGEAEVIYSIPYSDEAEIISYFFAGEELTDFKFEISSDGNTWSKPEVNCDYLESPGKWTKASYRLSELNQTKYIKAIFPETQNWWTPLIAKVSAVIGEAKPVKINIEGKNELIIPRYDFSEYQYIGFISDQIGEKFDGSVKFSIAESEIGNLEISEDGVIKIYSDFKDGSKFKIKAENTDYNLSTEIEVVLKAAVLGDVDGDGTVNENDVKIILTYFDKSELEDKDWKSVRDGDINKDGVIDIVDIAYVAKRAAINEMGNVE